jgi:hypothetical protein
MSTLTIELPETLAQVVRTHNVPVEEVQAVAVIAVENWLRIRPDKIAKGNGHENGHSRFSASAVPFVEKLIQENRGLFERLARL